MNKFVKSGLFLSVLGALTTTSNFSHAAKYEVELIANVVDSENLPLYENSYAVGINESGQTVSAVTDFYNFPIRFDLLSLQDFIQIVLQSQRESIVTFGLTPFNGLNPDLTQEEVSEVLEQVIEDFRSGNINGNDQAWIRRYLQNNPTNRIQSIGTNVVINKDTPLKLDFFDQPILDSTELSHSTRDIVTGISDNGWIYGQLSAPSLPLNNTDSDVVLWVRDFEQQGYIYTDAGSIVELEGSATLFGGASRIEDLAQGDNGEIYVVGEASVGYNPTIFEQIEQCDTITNNGSVDNPDTPSVDNLNLPAFCTQFYRNFTDPQTNAQLFDIDAYLWTLDENATVISQKTLGKLITPHPLDLRAHTSVATAVNSKGVAVGYSPDWVLTQPFNINISSAATIAESSPVINNAVIFKNGNVIDITGEAHQRVESRAFDINDSGIVVGYVSTTFSGVPKNRFFYYDSIAAEIREAEIDKAIANGEANIPEPISIVIPDGLFAGGASEAKAINNNGIIVGETEFERHLDIGRLPKPRRRHGFIYNINTNEFNDANELLTCEDRAKYEIVQISDINDSGEIVATAYVNQDRRDAIGEFELDENGNRLSENVLQAVKLKPILNGQVDICEEFEEQNRVKRQGASTSWLLLLLSSALFLRRK